MHHTHGQDSKPSNSIGKFVLIGFALVAGFFLLIGHRGPFPRSDLRLVIEGCAAPGCFSACPRMA